MNSERENRTEEEKVRARFSVLISVVIALAVTVGLIYGMEEYGITLFILIPVHLGFTPTIIYGIKFKISERKARKIGFAALGIYSVLLILFAMEGLICIIMAAPLALAFNWSGSLMAYSIINKSPDNAKNSMFVLFALLPTMAVIDKYNEPELHSVTTSIRINASPEFVWKNVIEFPRLKNPEEFIFRTGISYPIDAQIKGTGVGAIRYCNFTTGSFVEPITIWDEPNLLKFDVEEQPEPMKELNFWDVDAPHLHDYFVSKQGQFKLTRLSNGNTLLEGTTWYYHNISPEFYWKLWSDYIIHKIHTRVLEHIKMNSEFEYSRSVSK